MYQQRKKRIRNHILTTFNHHLLHSDKSTYFYNNKHSNDGNSHSTNINNSNYTQDSFLSAGHFPNDIRWTSPHCELDSSSSNDSHANRTRSSLSKMSHRKMAQLATVVKLANVAKSSMLHRTTCSTIPLVLCSFALLGLGIGLVNPSIGSSDVYADGMSTQSSNDGMSVSLTMDNPDINTLVNQSKLGQVNYISTGFNVSTTNVDEYSIYVQTAPGYSNKLTNGNLTIDFVKGANTPTTEFGDNTWGYAVSESGISPEGLKYSPVPDTGAIINPAYSTKDTTSDKSFTLNFAAKFGSNATPGHYTSSVILSVAAGASEIASVWDTIQTMQDMTTEICKDDSVPIGTTKQFRDSRDDKYYWVAKLADGNCWMTQNLDFDIPKALSKASSDVTNTSVNTNTIKVNTPAEWTSTESTYNAYYDPGDYIYNGPTDNPHGQGKSCGASNSNTDALKSCTLFSKQTVANSDPKVLSDTNRHYHVGNYYSFSAATVKSGDGLTTESVPASDSICPKGWKLPTGDNKEEFTELLTEYGVNSDMVSGDYAIYKEPLYFVYGGMLYDGKLNTASNSGYYWSSMTSSNAVVTALNFGSTVIPSAHNQLRYQGNSVRCVAR